MSSSLLAGVSAVPLDPPLGIPMFGYGARIGVAQGVHDPLYGRALYLGSDSELLIVEADLCLLAAAQADAIRASISARTGIPTPHILLGCTHTHSGPEPGFAAWLGRVPAPPHAERLFAHLEEAAVRAHAAARPARIGIGSSEVRIGRNRRREGGPVDPTIWVVRVDRPDHRPLAILYLHGCHPTVLGHENLAYSADWPGAASRAIEAAFPGVTALFALSAHADVDPRTRGQLDLTLADQSRGAGFEAMEALGREVGEAVIRTARAIATCDRARISVGATRLPIPVHEGAVDEARYERRLAERRARALEALELDPHCQLGTAELFRRIPERTRGLPPEEARERIARVRTYLRDRTAPRFAGARCPLVEVQVLRLDALWLLGLPAEPTVDVGFDWKRRLAGACAGVVSIANGWLRYLPHPSNFGEPNAHLAYEILMSTLVPEAATHLLDAGERLRAQLDET